MSGGRLALLCDTSGRILEVLRDDLAIVDSGSTRPMLPSLGTDLGSRRCFELLEALRVDTAAFGWLIELEAPHGAVGMYFAGLQRDGELLLVASEELSDIAGFADELQELNDEYLRRLRDLVKAHGEELETRAALPAMTELNNANTALERDLRRQQKELEQLIVAKNELLGMAAHDLRNPLTVIAGFLELLRLEEAVDAEHTDMLGEIEQAVELMTRILDGVLDVSAIESGILKLDVRLCDLEILVRRAGALHVLAARRAGVGIDLRSQGSIRVPADESKLHQVLNNLIANAVEHSPPGSTVTVLLERRGRDAVVSVSDQGAGIPEEQRSRVFEASERGGRDDRRGTGLGVAIARRIAQGHGGRLELAPVEGEGCRFELYLPLSAEGQP